MRSSREQTSKMVQQHANATKPSVVIKNKEVFISCEIYPFIKSKLLLIDPDYCVVFHRGSLDFLLQLTGSCLFGAIYYTTEL